MRQKSKRKSAWRFLGYAWAVLKVLFYLGLIYAAFGKMTSTFQALVLALLILIYQSMNNTLTMFLRTFVEEAHVVRTMFLGLYKKFNDPEVAEGEEGLRNIIKEYHKGDPVYYINSVGSGVAFFYILWKIVDVVVLQ